jgi:hypothetical protein
MSYICNDYNQYMTTGHRPVGNGQCAVFVESVTTAPRVHYWKRGIKVLGNGGSIHAGTVIATFNSEGKYPNMPHGNHTGLFLSENGHSITMIDQWHGKQHSHSPSPSTYSHYGSGNDHDMSNDPNYYYVVE